MATELPRPEVRGWDGSVRQETTAQWRRRFLETEATLGIRPPVRLFDVDGLGVSFAALRRSVGPSFDTLPWDEYDARRQRVELLMSCYPERKRELDDLMPRYFTGECGDERLEPLIDALSDEDRTRFDLIRPYRRRAMATFGVHKSGQHPLAWEVQRLADAPFTQPKDHENDYRGLERRFASSPPEVTEAPAYRDVIRLLAALTNDVRGGSVTTMRIVCHQMGLVARPSSGVTNAPEGIHQDGADYIVSALVIERHNVDGGESIVYGPDKETEHLRHTLLDGQGIFQADAGSPLWHWATPIHPVDPDRGAVRNILGYDIHVD